MRDEKNLKMWIGLLCLSAAGVTVQVREGLRRETGGTPVRDRMRCQALCHLTSRSLVFTTPLKIFHLPSFTPAKISVVLSYRQFKDKVNCGFD